MVRKGDTLIEVTLAIGIFSMVTIGIATVMNTGVSSAQESLETTLAREEIDTQAEALRFIHSAYIDEKGSNSSSSNRYTELWKSITNNAVAANAGEATNLLQYTPSTCAELYNGSGKSAWNQAFVINPRLLSTFSKAEKVYISSGKTNRFTQAVTYPHLVYGTSKTNNSDAAGYIDGDDFNALYKAEGIFVIAIKEKDSSFYDFYIRTCWYGSGADRPSTIATVIRLYNPDIVDN